MYVLNIKKDGEKHQFKVPPGYDSNDPIISQLNIYGRTLDTSIKSINESDIKFLEAAFESHMNPYVSYQAFSCLSDIFRRRSELFVSKQIWDLIEKAEDKPFDSFTALSIDLAENAIYSPAIKRTSPYLKYLFKYAAEGETSEMKNFALHALNQVANMGPEYIRNYMFKRARFEIQRSLENPSIDAEVSRDYYAITSPHHGQLRSNKENILSKKDQAEFDLLLGIVKEIEKEVSQKYEKKSYYAERDRLLKDKLNIDDPEKLKKLLKLVLNKNSQNDHLGYFSLIAGSTFAEEGYELLKDFISEGVSRDNHLSLRLLNSAFYMMPEKYRKSKGHELFNFTISILPILDDENVGDMLGWFVGRDPKLLGLKNFKPNDDQMKIIRERIQKFVDGVEDFSRLEEVSKINPWYDRPRDLHNKLATYQALAEFYRGFEGRDYAGVEIHEKILARRRTEWQAEQKKREERRRLRKAIKEQKDNPASLTLS